MKFQSHLVIGLLFALIFLRFSNYYLIFLAVVLISCLLPDIDSSNSYLGHKWYFRPIQWFVRHRGVIHSFTFCFIISIIFALFIPILAFPFFLGYGSHLITDSLTVEGITPLWPFKGKIVGNIKTGGRVEDGIFISIVIIDVLLIIWFFV